MLLRVLLLLQLVLLHVLLLLQLLHTFAGTSSVTICATVATVDTGGILAKISSTAMHPVTNFWRASQLTIGWGRRWWWDVKMMIAMHPAIAKFVTRITSYNWTRKFSSHHYGPHLNLTTFLQHPPICLAYNLISHLMAIRQIHQSILIIDFMATMVVVVDQILLDSNKGRGDAFLKEKSWQDWNCTS